MIERVKNYILSRDLIGEDEKVLVAVSGGVDSMVLLHVLIELGFDVSVAHMNFQLRGEESDLDEKLVKETCELLNVPFYSKIVKLSGDQSTQMEARELRYGWFEELMDEHGFNKLATAHHLNDSLETVLLNLTKGTGISGVSGIPTSNERIVRPLLCLTRTDILAYATDKEIAWREDASNADSKYQRNLVRNEVIPLLEQINPSVIETFRQTQERLEGTRQLVDQEVSELREKHLKEGELDLSWKDNSNKSLMLLSELLKDFGASYVLSKEIFECSQSGKQFETNSHLLIWDRGTLIIQQEDQSPNEQVQISGAGNFIWGSLNIEVDEIEVNEIDRSFPLNEAYLDASKLAFPIVVRSWTLGDEFRPFGMRGRKKLSDFFIDQKVSVIEKKSIPIFTQNNRILWVGNHRIDDDFKVTDQTKKVIRIRLNSVT